MDVKAKRKLNQNHDESDVDVIKKKSNKNDDERIEEMENEELKEEINILNEYSNVKYCEEDCSDKEIGDSNQTVAKIKCMEKDKRVDTCVKVTNKFVNEDQKNNKLEIHVQDLSDASPLLVQVSFPSKNISKVEEWRKILSRGNTICIMNGIKKEKKKNKTIITHLEIDEKSTIAKMSSQMKFENIAVNNPRVALEEIIEKNSKKVYLDSVIHVKLMRMGVRKFSNPRAPYAPLPYINLTVADETYLSYVRVWGEENIKWLEKEMNDINCWYSIQNFTFSTFDGETGKGKKQKQKYKQLVLSKVIKIIINFFTNIFSYFYFYF